MYFDAFSTVLHEAYCALHADTTELDGQLEALNDLFLFLDTHRQQLFPAVLITQACQMLEFCIEQVLPHLAEQVEECQEILVQYQNLLQSLKTTTVIAKKFEQTCHLLVRNLQTGNYTHEQEIAEALLALARLCAPAYEQQLASLSLQTFRRNTAHEREYEHGAAMLGVVHRFLNDLAREASLADALVRLQQVRFGEMLEYVFHAYFEGKAVFVNPFGHGVVMPIWVMVDCARTSDHVEFGNYFMDAQMQHSADIARMVACMYLRERFGKPLAENIAVRCHFPNPGVGYRDASASLLIGIKIVGEVLGLEQYPGTAVTGALDDFGHILEVGWVPQKIQAVREYDGVLRILIPFSDVQHVLQLDQPTQKSLRPFTPYHQIQIIPVRNFHEAIEAYYGRPQLATFHHHADWGEAPDLPVFFGRSEELDTLKHWILTEKCRLVAIVGMKGVGKTRLSLKFTQGGIGKTDLSLTLAQSIHQEFDYAIWRSMLNAPPLPTLLIPIIKFLSDQQELDLSEDPAALISKLVHYLKTRRCFIILDNVETILLGGEQTGQYREGFEAYGMLFEKIGELPHQSCVLLTSREKPPEIRKLAGKTQPVRLLELGGLAREDIQALFAEIGDFRASDEEWQELVDRYSGNPLALELASRYITGAYHGHISTFLAAQKAVFHDLNHLLDWHFTRLSEREQEIGFWLAINREPATLTELREDLVDPEAKALLETTLETLESHIPVEKAEAGFSLQPVFIEYLTDQIIEQVCQEILTGEVRLLNSHALMKASAKDYVREIQRRLILHPVLSWSPINLEKELRQLLSLLRERSSRKSGYYVPPAVRRFIPEWQEKLNRIAHSHITLEAQLKTLLGALQTRAPRAPGYAGGNILNLLGQLNGDLNGCDFSSLCIWQAYLQNIAAHDVHFDQADFRQLVFTQVFSRVLSVAFSPDSVRLALGAANGDIQIWQVQDRKQIAVWKAHTDWIRSIRFHPNGALLISASDDETIGIWEAQSGRLLRRLHKHRGRVLAVAVSPDGELLASGGQDRILRLWEISTGKCLVELSRHPKWIQSLAFHPEGNLLASNDCDGLICLWDVRSGDCLRTLQVDNPYVWSLAFAPGEDLLASGGCDLRLWDFRNGTCVQTLSGHTGDIRTVAFSPDGSMLASGSRDHTVKIWNVQIGQVTHVFDEHTESVLSVSFSPDGRTLASGSDDQTVKLWNIHTGQCLTTLQGYSRHINAIAIHPQQPVIASGGSDRLVRLWDVETAQCLREFHGHTGWVTAVMFHPEGRLLISASNDYSIRIWDLDAGQCRQVLQGHTRIVRGICLLDGNRLASTGQDTTIRLWNIHTGECLLPFEEYDSEKYTLALDPGKQVLAAGCEDGVICLWDLHTHQIIGRFYGHSAPIWSLAFSPDGALLASCSSDASIRIWDVRTGETLQDLKDHASQVKSVAFHPQGRVLASGSYDQTVRVWDVQTGQCLHTFAGHTAAVWSVAFSPKDTFVASSSDDETIKLWDWRNPACLKTLKAPGPYERMKITGATGLTEAQRATLKILGAVE